MEAATLVVLCELIDSDDEKPTRGKTRKWIKRRAFSAFSFVLAFLDSSSIFLKAKPLKDCCSSSLSLEEIISVRPGLRIITTQKKCFCLSNQMNEIDDTFERSPFE